MPKIKVTMGIFALAIFLAVMPVHAAQDSWFIVPMNMPLPETIGKLQTDGYMRFPFFLKIALWWNGVREINPGGYAITEDMGIGDIARIFGQEPALEWIVIPEGLRKEEIADLLVEKLGWTAEMKSKWISEDTAEKPEYLEGVYFPDTYLIPRAETPADVARRLQAKFQEKFAPFAREAQKQNIKWDTLIKIASLVQREASSKDDMPLIAGIIWNRLLSKMKLDIDATVQYARGKTDQGWWAPLKAGETGLDSGYNTYKNIGLPPHPIANPGLDAIDAVLRPGKTDCLFYLHDRSKQVHCAKTYEEHKDNIRQYLQ